MTAVNIAFDPAELALPAGGPLRIVLDNQDSGVPHNVKVFLGDREIAKSPIVTGPATTEVRFGPLPPAATSSSARSTRTCWGPRRHAVAGRAAARRQPPAGPPPSPGSVIDAGSRSSSSRSGAMPRSTASSRIVRPLLSASLASAAAAS